MNSVDRFGSFSGSRGSLRHYDPSPDIPIELVEDVGLESLEDHAIGPLDLTVGMWVPDRGPIDPDVVSVTEVQELLPGEVSSVVSDDTFRNTKTIDDIKEEFDRLFRANVGDRLRLYPLGEFVHRY